MLLIQLTTNCTEQSPSWEANSHSASQEISRLLWNPKVFLPGSQEPAKGPCPEQDESSPHLRNYFPKNHSNIIFSADKPLGYN
jgi:hypothetical protein